MEASKRAGDLRLIANAFVQLGFTLLWANKIEESIRTFETRWQDINRIGDKIIATRGITYHYIACLRGGDVAKTEKLVNEYLHSGNYPPVPEYLFSANSVLTWISWKKKEIRLMEEYFAKCMDMMAPGQIYSPFRFLYVMPMTDHYFEINSMEKINPLLQHLNMPGQRKLELDLQEAVDKCLTGGEAGRKGDVPDKDSVQLFLDLAKRYNYY